MPRVISRVIWVVFVLTGMALRFPQSALAEGKSEPPSQAFTADYPDKDAGVLIENGGWLALDQESPKTSRVKRGAAASLTYGAVPATIISEYPGIHSETKIRSA